MNTENPYLRWLGLDHHNPNHFELLGVDPDESDSGTITSAAKSALEKLGENPEGDDQLSWKRVRRHIKLAYQCLKDPAQREIYRCNLSAYPQNGSEPTSYKTTATPVEDAIDDIPQALPLAEIVEEEDSETNGPKTSASEPSMAAPIIEDADDGVHRRRRAGNAIPIIMILVLVSAGSWAAFKYIIQPMLANQKNEERPNDQTQADQIEKENRTTEPQNEIKSGNSGRGHAPANASQTPDDLANQPKTSAPLDGQANDLNDPGNNQTTQSTQALGDEGHHDSIDTSWANIGNPTPRDNLAIHHHLEESLLAMKRRLWETMIHHLNATRSYTMTADQVAVWRRQMSIAVKYRSFWDSVVSKAGRLTSMTEFAIGDDRVVVVEAKSESLVYRVFGQRIETRYEALPTLIALEISGYGLEESDPDLMENRLVAFVVAARLNPEHRDEAERLSLLAREAGLITDHYVEFLDDDVHSFYKPEQRFPKLRNAQVVPIIEKLAETIDVMKPVDNFTDDELIDRITELRDLSFGAGPEDAIAFIYRASQLSVRAKNPDLMNEMLNLQRRFSRHGAYYPNYIASYGQLLKRDLDDQSAYRFIGYILEVADQIREEEKLTEASDLVRHAKSLANKHGFDILVDRIDRIYGEGNSRKAGRLGI